MTGLVRRMRKILSAAAIAAAIPLTSTVADVPTGGSGDKIAVVIGNRAYRNPRIPSVEYARRDADSIGRYLKDVLRFREDDVIDLRDAGQAEMEAALGNARSVRGKLWQLVKPGRSEVVVYYSGHGAPGLTDHKGYLMPSDADPEKPEINGYPIETLLQNLSKLEARSVIVYLDACFSGDTPKGSLLRSASPITVAATEAEAPSGVTMLAAGRADQIASWDDKARHGLFTEHLLDALYGKADRPPYGNADGRVTGKEAKAYLDDVMTYAARREFGRAQNASLIGDEEVAMSYLPGGRPVSRMEPKDERTTIARTAPALTASLPPPPAVTSSARTNPSVVATRPKTAEGRSPEGIDPRQREQPRLPNEAIPKRALEDCEGKSEGDVIRHLTPEGPVTAACLKTPQGLAARPLRFPRESVSPPSTDRGYVPATASENVYFTSESIARQACAGDVVVWVNMDTMIYHYAGRRWYGRTKDGAYMCERSRSLVGARPAANRQ